MNNGYTHTIQRGDGELTLTVSQPPVTLLVLGIGNLLLGDEGVGVHAAQKLQRVPRLEGVEVLEVGTAILEALPALEEADSVILLDAVQAGGAPGSIYRFALDRAQGNPCIASMHGFDIFRVLTLTRRQTPLQVVVLGVEPARISWSIFLSPPVTRAIPGLLAAVEAEIDHLRRPGAVPTPRSPKGSNAHVSGHPR